MSTNKRTIQTILNINNNNNLFFSNSKENNTDQSNLLFTKELQEKLNQDGYVVVPNVISIEKAEEYKEEFWTWLSQLGTGIKRDDPSTWTDDRWPLVQKDIITYPSISHAEFIWKARAEPNVVKVFSELWKTNELLVGFCRANIMRPSQYSGKFIEPWHHVDQRDSKPDRVSVQGLLNLEDCGNRDGGLMVYPKSHLYHQALFKHFKTSTKKDWYRHSSDELMWLFTQNNACKPTYIEAPAGSLILWDSRTIHYNRSPWPNNNNKFRYAIYICQTPASFLTDKKIIKKKQDAFHNRKSTSHWPHEVYIFPENPTFRASQADKDKVLRLKKPPAIRDDQMTETMKQLAGLNLEIQLNKRIKKY